VENNEIIPISVTGAPSEVSNQTSCPSANLPTFNLPSVKAPSSALSHKDLEYWGHIYFYSYYTSLRYIGKSVPLQVWSGPEGSRKLRFPDYMTTAQDGGKVDSLMHRSPLPPKKYSWYSFLLEDESTPGP